MNDEVKVTIQAVNRAYRVLAAELTRLHGLLLVPGWLLVKESGPTYVSTAPGGGLFAPDEVLDVYTKAEQEANGALVQIDTGIGTRRVTGLPEDMEVIDWAIELFHPLRFLTAEATAALGEFTKIDRPILAGLTVRHGLIEDPWTVYSIRNGIAYDRANTGCPESELTVVAEEDATPIAPPVIKEPEPAPKLTAAEWEEKYQLPCFGSDGDPAPVDLDDDNLATWDRSAPSVIKEPAPEWCRKPGHSPGCTCPPDPAPSNRSEIPDGWALIMAGDTLLFKRNKVRSNYRWIDREGMTYTDGEAALIGPVRQAVVIDVPDSWTVEQVQALVDGGKP